MILQGDQRHDFQAERAHRSRAFGQFVLFPDVLPVRGMLPVWLHFSTPVDCCREAIRRIVLDRPHAHAMADTILL
jgi:hypothetical protein